MCIRDRSKIDRGKRIVEIFKQPQYSPIPVELQVAVLWAVQNGYVDQVPVPRIKEYQAGLSEFLTTRRAALLERIAVEKAIDASLTSELKAATDAFAQTWTPDTRATEPARA